MKNNSVYIKVDEVKNLVHTSGITFQDFILGTGLVNKGYLIMAGFPAECGFNMNLLFEYVSKDQAEALVKENVYNYGDFCWVDFENEEQLNSVTKDELAELLYMSHMKEPLSGYKIKSLDNRYAYLCHDDGWWNNTYMDDVNEYRAVLKYKLKQELQGRKRTISEPDDALIDTVFEMCRRGLVIDFEKKTPDSVNLFCVGDMPTMDDLENRMDMSGNKAGFNIIYNSRKKSWEHFGI